MNRIKIDLLPNGLILRFSKGISLIGGVIAVDIKLGIFFGQKILTMDKESEHIKNAKLSAKLLGYDDLLTTDEILDLAKESVNSLYSATKELILGCLTIKIAKGAWGYAARFVMDVLYLVLGVWHIVEYINGLVT